MNRSEEKTRLKMRNLIFVPILVVMLAIALAVSTFYYIATRDTLMNDLDNNLYIAANMAQAALPDDYHDKITGPSSVSDKDFLEIVDKYNQLCIKLDMEYLWSLMEIDGKIVFTSSTSPDKIAANGKQASFFEIHSNPELYINTFQNMTPSYQINDDKWGRIRAVLVPFTDSHGRKYLFGASMRMTEIDRKMSAALWKSLIFLFGMAVFALLLSFVLSWKVTKPITNLVQTIQKIMSGDKSAVVKEEGSAEQALLARNFNQLNQQLHEKMENLQKSEAKQAAMIENISDAICISDSNNTVKYISPNITKMLGWMPEEIQGKYGWEYIHPDDIKDMPERFSTLLNIPEEEARIEARYLCKNGLYKNVEVIASNKFGIQGIDGILSTFHDITERKKAEYDLQNNLKRNESLIEILQNPSETIQGYLDFALKQAVWLTESKYGYIYLYNEKKREFILNTWSSENMNDCQVKSKYSVSQMEKMGIWGRAVSQRKPIIINDFIAQCEHEKGFPEGHVQFNRYMTIPVIDGDEIVAVVGVADKKADYTEIDVYQLTILMSNVWKETARKKNELQLKESEEKFRQTFDLSPVGSVLVSMDGQFMSCNKSFANFLDYEQDEVIGKRIEDVTHPEDIFIGKSEMKAIAEGKMETAKVEKRYIRKDGKTVWGEVSISLARDVQGKPQYFLPIIQDITAKINAKNTIAESEEKYRYLFESAGVGIGYYTTDGSIISYNKSAADNMGGKPEDYIGKSIYDLFPKADADIYMNRVNKAVLNDETMQYEDIVPLPSGKRWFISSFNRIKSADGNVIGVQVVSQDITWRKQAELEYKTIIQTANEGFFVVNDYGYITEVNPAYCSMIGFSRDELLKMHISDIEAIETYDEVIEHQKRIKASGYDIFESRHKRKDGSIIDVETRAHVIEGKNEVCAFFTDITERKKKEEEIQYLSYYDILTGLYNRTFFETEMVRLDVERQLPISIIMGDINGLKLTNDVFGHEAGDTLLKEVALILKSCCRAEDIVARIGGDEFIIILPQTNEAEARQVCGRIYIACEKHSINLGIESFQPSISLGHSTKNENSLGIRKVLKEAEDTMYKRKLFEQRSMHSSLVSSIRTTIFEKSQETKEHADRMVNLTKTIGLKMNLSEEKLYELELLAALHDIGKIGIDDRILSKPGKLTDIEWEEIRRHPEIGYRIALASPELLPIAECILSHHERWDGSGYPQGLSGEGIPLLARILSVVDAYDAMTNDRVYRKALCEKEAMEEIQRNSGVQFDETIVKIFFGIIDEK